MSATDPVADAVSDTLADKGPIALAIIGSVAAVAFGIKGAWVAWRAGSKAMGKVGS